MQRQGSGAAYLNIFHADINDFLDTRKISADDDIRVKTLSIGVVIPDKFIELMREDKDAYLFYPHTVYKAYGVHLDEMNMKEMYDTLVDDPRVRKEKINPRQLFQKLAILRSESGYPYIMFADNVNKVHANNHISEVKFSNLCVTGDALLNTENGQISAKELYKRQNDLKVVIDNRTKSYNPIDKGTDIVNAIPMQLTKRNAEVYKVKTKQGFEIKATAWHKFYVKTKNGIEKKQLNQLAVGERLLVQSGEGSYGEINEPKLAYIMGIIAGDGVLNDNTSKIYLYDNKKHLADKVEKYVQCIINDHRIDRVYKHNADFKPTFNVSNSELQDLLYISSTPLKDILNKFGMNKENKTRVPKFIFSSDKETQAAYLSGLFQMDACVNANYDYKALTVELSSVDFEGLQDVQRILINMGIYSTIYSNYRRENSFLPNGKGDLTEYKVKPIHKLSIQDRISREMLVKVIELKEYDMYKFNMLTNTLQPKSRKPKHDHTAEITSIKYYGQEDVYDTTQKDYSSLIFNGLVTGNCSEILQASKVSTYNDYDVDDEIGMDISCNLASINIKNVMKNKSLANVVSIATDALTTVSESTSIANAPAVRNANEKMKSIGLGAMNLHGFLAEQHIAYESPEARDFANSFFMAMNYYSIKRSAEIARDRGETYYRYDESTYATGEYFTQYVTTDFTPEFDKVAALFEGMHLPTMEDWKELQAFVSEHGLYHSYRLAIAPTGSISYVQSATASVMPIMERIEERTYGNSKTYYPMPGLTANNWFFFKEAYDMDMFNVVDMIGTIQQHIDQGISFTLFLKDTMTTRDLNRIDLYAHHKGVKTIYYARTKDTGQDDCLSCVV